MRRTTRGFTILELAISLALIVTLLALLLPALTSARAAAQRTECANNQRRIYQAWEAYLEEHDDRFPVVGTQPAWRYGGVRFSLSTGEPFVDHNRPLNPYLPWQNPDAHDHGDHEIGVFCCPADAGITDADGELGTGRRTAFRSYGTSYRANARLLSGSPEDSSTGMARNKIKTLRSRMLLMGDPVWFEAAEETGRLANWHGDGGGGNLLFLNGSIRFMTVMPKDRIGPVVFEPVPTDVTMLDGLGELEDASQRD